MSRGRAWRLRRGTDSHPSGSVASLALAHRRHCRGVHEEYLEAAPAVNRLLHEADVAKGKTILGDFEVSLAAVPL